MFPTHPFPQIPNVESTSTATSQLTDNLDMMTQIAEHVLMMYDTNSVLNLLSMTDHELYQFLNEKCGVLFAMRTLLQVDRGTRTTLTSSPMIQAMLMPIVIQLNQLRHRVLWWDNDTFWQSQHTSTDTIAQNTTISDFFVLVELCNRLREQFERRDTHPPRLRASPRERFFDPETSDPSLWR